MPRNPKLLSKNEQPTKLGDPPEWHPLFLLTTIGILLEAIFLFVTWYVFCLERLVWYVSLLVLFFKSSILAGHTYLRDPNLYHDLLELLSMLHLNLLWARTCSSASLISFFNTVCLVFLKKCSLASLRFIWELVNSIVICFAYKFSPNMKGTQEGYNKNFHEYHWTK